MRIWKTWLVFNGNGKVGNHMIQVSKYFLSTTKLFFERDHRCIVHSKPFQLLLVF